MLKHLANGINLRLALLLMLAVAVGATYLVEQPSSSLLLSHDRLDELARAWREIMPAPCNNKIE